jgi:tRNA threonylcarbamoyladenosine biosynthesis protein TsaB
LSRHVKAPIGAFVIKFKIIICNFAKIDNYRMIYILNIETATRNCSVSIGLNEKTIAIREVAESGYSHAEKLHVFISEVLNESNLTFQDLSAIAVSQGPGSYTGLRIGVSAAKGLCYALGIPLIAIDTLETLSRQLIVEEGLIIPMLDARRMECYTAIFDENYQKIREIQAEIMTQDSFANIESTLHLVGDGIAKCKGFLRHSKLIFHDEIVFPSANEMTAMAFKKYQKSDTVDVAYFEPYYLKDFMMTTSSK